MTSERQKPVINSLKKLLLKAEVTAAAIRDNAIEESMPIDKELPEGPLTGLPRRISRAIVDLNSTLDRTIKAADSTSKALVIQQVNFQGGSENLTES